MTDLVRQEIAAAAHTLVVKVGSRILTGADGLLDQTRIEAWPKNCTRLSNRAAKWRSLAPGPWPPAWAG